MATLHTLPVPANLLDGFTAYERAVLGMSPNTLRNHGIYLTTFFRWWSAAQPGQLVTRAAARDIAGFLVAESERGMSARTRRGQLGALRGFYNWLVLTEQTGANPAAMVPSPRVNPPLLEIYAPAQIKAILSHTASLTDVRGRQRHAIVATLRFSGIRSGELRTMRQVDLDLGAGRARVVGKGSRERVALLPPALLPILGEFLADVRPQLPASPLLLANAHPFVTTPLHGFGTDALCREVELAGLGAHVEGRHHPHKWRHTYATELVRAGVDIHVVQRLLGHTHIASTVGYTHLSLEDLRGQVSALWNPAVDQ